MDAIQPKKPGGGTSKGVMTGGHAVWQYAGAVWVLKKTACEEGYECGDPPKGKGDYEGEIRRTACVPKKK